MKPLIDLHCHTVFSGHAYSTMKENIEEAKTKDLKVIGISDHAPSIPGGPHIFYFYNINIWKKEINGVRVLKGAEANIMDYEGHIDLPEKVLENLDYVIASLHLACLQSGSIDENTNAILEAIKNPHIKIIGHPDDNRYPIHYDQIVKTAKEYNVLLEINNSSLNVEDGRPGAWENLRTMLDLCKKYETKIIMNSDAHIYYEVGGLENSLQILKEVNFPDELVANYDLDIFRSMGIEI